MRVKILFVLNKTNKNNLLLQVYDYICHLIRYYKTN
jgi:hypothetical protein